MLKKIIILALIIWGLLAFYRKFLASSFNPFFKKNTNKVDLLTIKSTPIDKVVKEEAKNQ